MNYNYFILLLKSMILNYPILRSWGYVLGKPVVLAFDDMENADTMLFQLSERFIIIDETMNDKQVREALQYGTNSNVVVYFLDAAVKSPANQKKLKTLDKLASKGNKEGCVALIAVSAKNVSEDLLRRYLCFHVDQTVPKFKFAADDIIPEAESLELIRDKIAFVQGDAELKALYGAAYFLYPKLSKSHGSMYQRLLHSVPQMIDYADAFAESRDVFNVICDCFIKFARQGGFEPLIVLPNVERDIIENMDMHAFCNGEILYLSERRLREIMQPVVNIITVSDIKACLVAHHVLLTDRGGYTKKMQYIDPYGKVCRCRMLALNIERIKTKEEEVLEYEL